MKNHVAQLGGILLLLFICIACRTEKKNLPELTYAGEEPRVQLPLSPEESKEHIQLPDGFEAFLYASEPEIINPIAFAWDERGRLWVVQSQDYPHGLANDVGGDRITICEDTDGDGKADSFTDFATEQSLSTGIVIVKGGAIVAQAPEMVFLEDTDGDDKMDKRTVLFDGFGTWDTHAGPANLKYGTDNQIWGSVGYSGFENTFEGKNVSFTRGVYRFSQDGKSFEPIGQFNNNTWGLGITQDFQIFGSTANNNHACYIGIPLRYYEHLPKRPSWALNADFIQGHYEISSPDPIPLQQVDVRGGYTAAAGANFYTAANYPAEYQNQMYVNEPTGHLVHLAKIVPEGAGFKEIDGGNIFASTDAWTAPVYTETGPDGNLWVADWYNPVIQHNPDKRGMENQIWNADKGEGNAHLNPLRDKGHGRIYIIKHKNGDPSEIKKLDPADSKGLLAGLESDNMFWRITAQRLIVENEHTDLIPDLLALAGEDESGLNAPAIHALWSLHALGALDGSNEDANSLLEKTLAYASSGVKRSALSLLPADAKGSELLLQSGLLESDDPQLKLAAILKASELPETDQLFQIMEKLSQEESNFSDPWLKAAIKIYFREQNYEDIREEEVAMLIPASDEGGSHWQYTESEPKENWNSLDFDDSNWKSGEGVFGTADRGPAIKTSWSSDDIWMRKTIQLEGEISDPVLKIWHDDNYEVYVNGKLLFAEKGATGTYKFIRLDPELGSFFKKGENVLAVYCHNGGGLQFIDTGIGKVAEFRADKSIDLHTVSQKMAYDKTVLHAMAGENLEIRLNNKDEMPHNLVLIEEGKLEDFGKLVDKFLQSPDAAESEYVPQSRYVIAATEMLDPEEVGVIRIKVPDKPGDYPFLCTFPGHWRLMQGILKVSPKGTYISDNKSAPEIALMGGGGSHNFEKFFGVADGKIMSQEGKNTVNYTESPAFLRSLLPSADILCISNNKAYDAETKQAIISHVNNGKSMMIYHPSTWYNWEDWPEYNQQLVGGGSRSHEKLQEFEVKVVKPNHPIMKGVLASFRIVDELYRWEKDPNGTDIEVLAIGKGLESGEEYPVVWIVKHPKAKIVGNTLGHDERAHDLPPYQTILNNSLNWVKRKSL
ncbi:MAG: ThuA domain-containing protein [Bacteroidia bacterium]|nr:ThuA domain-containing protein [Bacteroidia bacterium]